jgi:hypothetical protein
MDTKTGIMGNNFINYIFEAGLKILSFEPKY